MATYRTVLTKQETKELETLELTNDTVYYASDILRREGAFRRKKGG